MTRPPLGRTLLRLFTLQSSWNYDRLQGVGFAVAEEPLLRDLSARGDGVYRAALARGAQLFNAHPYLSGLAVGAVARAEHDGTPPAQIERLRQALGGPLGSLGDRLVWAGWLPLNAALTLIGVALGWGWWAVVGFLTLYNVGHVFLRVWALRAGWTRGNNVVEALRAPGLSWADSLLGVATPLAVGASLPLTAVYLGHPFPGWARVVLASVALGGLGLLQWRPFALTSLRLGLVVLAAALVVGWVWR
jgi:mannose PTS system EIID component